jgi:hypothetical protein
MQTSRHDVATDLSQPMTSDRGILAMWGGQRGGTSAMTFVLRTLGSALGDNRIAPAADDLKSFWEDKAFVVLNDDIPAHFAQTWDSLAPAQTRDLANAGLDPQRSRARELLGQKLSGTGRLGIKDPRTARLLPFWLPVNVDPALDARVLLSFREPLSVIRSLAWRECFPDGKSRYLGLLHVLPALLDTDGHLPARVGFDDLMARPDAEIRRIARELGFAERRNQTLFASYGYDFLEKGLLHARGEEQSFPDDPAIPDLARHVYGWWRRPSTSPSVTSTSPISSPG